MNLAKHLDTKSILSNRRHSGTPTMKLQKQKSGEKKKNICYSNKKNKVIRNHPNQGGKRHILRELHNTEERN